MEEPKETSPLLEELNAKKERANNALQRCRKALQAVDKYMGNISIEHLDVSKLGEAMDIYDTTEEKWDDKILEIQKELEGIKASINQETDRLENTVENKKLRTNVVVGLIADSPAELEITLIYGMLRDQILQLSGFFLTFSAQLCPMPIGMQCTIFESTRRLRTLLYRSSIKLTLVREQER